MVLRYGHSLNEILSKKGKLIIKHKTQKKECEVVKKEQTTQSARLWQILDYKKELDGKILIKLLRNTARNS